MSKLLKRPFAKTSLALLALAILGLFALAVFRFSEHGQREDQARNYYQNGVKFIEQHDYAKARIELRNALRSKNDMLPAWRSVAQIEETTQHWNDVIFSLRRIVDLDPSDIEARTKLVKLLARAGRNHDALELTDTGNEATSRNAKILGLKAAILYARNDKSSAIQQAQAAIRIQPGNTDALVVLATDRMANGDAKGALQILDSEAALHNADLAVQQLKLKIFEQLGETQKIESLLRSLVETNPQEIAFQNQLIKFYIAQHREEDAEKQLRATIEAKPSDPQAELELVRLLYTRQDWTSAQATAEMIRNAGDPRGIADQVLGAALMGQHSYDESVAVFQNAVDASSSAIRPMVSLVGTLIRANKTDRAVAFLESALRSNPNNAEARVLMGSIQLSTGAHDQALESFKLAIEKQPKSAVGYQALANLYNSEKKPDEALKVIQSGRQMLPDSMILQLATAGILEQN